MRLAAVVLVSFLAMSAVWADEAVRNTSYQTAQGERVLQCETVVNADVDTVWKTMTTSEGLRSFLAPVVAIDLKIGGLWESSYDAKAKIGDKGNIVNEIICYVPPRLLSIRIKQTPTKFPHSDEAKQLWTVLEFEKTGPQRTRVVCTMLGFKTGPAWDDLYKFFDRGNVYTLQKLHVRLEKH